MKSKLTLALIIFLGYQGVNSVRLHDEDSDEQSDLELNGSAVKNSMDIGVYARTFLGEGKSITKLN
jgi:hypothetical protein